MDINGIRQIALPRAAVWEALNDAETLGKCIPGCRSIEKIGDAGFTAAIAVKIGPVEATFSGSVKLKNIVPNEGYSLLGQGEGGVAGFARGSARVTLEDYGEDTLLAYTIDAMVGGKLARIGGRLINSTAEKLAEQFFDNFGKVVAECDAIA